MDKIGRTSDLPLDFRVDGDRVSLRAPRRNDARTLADVRTRSRRFLRAWSPAPKPGVSVPDAAREQVRNDLRAWRADLGYAFCVVPRRGDALVGRVALNQVVRGVFQNAYIGYWIDASHAGRGWMTEAVRLALDTAFGPLGLHRVQAAIMPRNAPSLALARRIGFRKEGRAERYLKIAGAWEDHEIFALTREEWSRGRRRA
jgi:ribosomal-protein-alanine N-acetyltransferase